MTEDKRLRSPQWYYRSDNDPMNPYYQNIKWNNYSCSEIIENAFKQFIYSIILKDESREYLKTFEIPNSDYLINFETYLQLNKYDYNKSRYVGRFVGDPEKTYNTLTDKNSIYENLIKNSNSIPKDVKLINIRLQSTHLKKTIRILLRL